MKPRSFIWLKFDWNNFCAYMHVLYMCWHAAVEIVSPCSMVLNTMVVVATFCVLRRFSRCLSKYQSVIYAGAAFNALSKIFYSVVIVECFMHIRKNAKVPRNINQVRIFRTNYSSPVYNCSSFTISINVVSIAGIKFDSYSNGNIFADWLQCLITKATSDQLAMLWMWHFSSSPKAIPPPPKIWPQKSL
jgi:hypothetical protein